MMWSVSGLLFAQAMPAAAGPDPVTGALLNFLPVTAILLVTALVLAKWPSYWLAGAGTLIVAACAVLSVDSSQPGPMTLAEFPVVLLLAIAVYALVAFGVVGWRKARRASLPSQ